MNTGIRGHFESWQEGVGYTLTFSHHKKGWFGRSKPIFLFKLRHDTPAQWVADDGAVYRPAARFFTDGGSSPVVTHGWCYPFRFLGFFWHDSGYHDHGLTIKPLGETRFRFVKLSQVQLDDLLRVMCLCDPSLPCGRAKARLIWGILRGFGRWAWIKGDDLDGIGPCPPQGDILPV
jgi:hypothetical protein